MNTLQTALDRFKQMNGTTTTKAVNKKWLAKDVRAVRDKIRDFKQQNPTCTHRDVATFLNDAGVKHVNAPAWDTQAVSNVINRPRPSSHRRVVRQKTDTRVSPFEAVQNLPVVKPVVDDTTIILKKLISLNLSMSTKLAVIKAVVLKTGE